MVTDVARLVAHLISTHGLEGDLRVEEERMEESGCGGRRRRFYLFGWRGGTGAGLLIDTKAHKVYMLILARTRAVYIFLSRSLAGAV